MTLIFAQTIAAVAGHDVRLDSFGDVESTNHPPGWAAAVLVPIVVIWLSFVAHQVLSWRRATGERRQQLKWLACGAAITLVSFAVSQQLSTSAVGQLLGIGLVALPVSIGVGILKYRLYEIDRIISRTLAYAIVTGLLVGISAGLVLPGDAGTVAFLASRGGRVHPGGGRVVQPATPAGAAGGGPAVQPGPV